MEYSPYNAKNKALKIEDIEKILHSHGLPGYQVKNARLFQESMIHTSYVLRKDGYTTPTGQVAVLAPCPDGVLKLQDSSYERNEFLGDSMLGASVSNYIWERFPDADPGFLTDLRKKIVNNKTLGGICQKLGLDAFYVISRHVEESCAGRINLEKLGDVMEAFLAALWKDCGHDFTLFHKAVTTIIEKHLKITQLLLKNENYKDQFQKHCQKHLKYTPTYTMIASVNGEFTMAVIDPSGKHLGIGRATTKQQAEQNACKEALKEIHD
jgi:dsRNA-specific ribonuclease